MLSSVISPNTCALAPPCAIFLITASKIRVSSSEAFLTRSRTSPSDERSSLGIVRLRVKKASQELGDVFGRIMSKVEREKAAAGAAFESPFAEITDEDIDSLFSE